jgi:hypothetical protein
VRVQGGKSPDSVPGNGQSLPRKTDRFAWLREQSEEDVAERPPPSEPPTPAKRSSRSGLPAGETTPQTRDNSGKSDSSASVCLPTPESSLAPPPAEHPPMEIEAGEEVAQPAESPPGRADRPVQWEVFGEDDTDEGTVAIVSPT